MQHENSLKEELKKRNDPCTGKKPTKSPTADYAVHSKN